MTAPIIDTHLHLIYQDRLRYPWVASAPNLDRDFRFGITSRKPTGSA